MASKRTFLGLDVGAKRIGVALGDSIARIAQPIGTIVDAGDVAESLANYLANNEITDVVVGRPRDQAGRTTTQTAFVEKFVADYLDASVYAIHWQDESVTSLLAEERLEARKKPYNKADIDAEAAAIILQDYLETV